MNRTFGCFWLPALSILCCLPVCSATIYKSVDENGVVIFSDTMPPEDVLVETLEIEVQAPPEGLEAQRLQDMRETTDRMVADRMAREKHRAELRQLDAQTEAQQSSQDVADYYEPTTIYTGGYYGYPIRRPWRRHDHPRPNHPVTRPPLRPPVTERLPGNDYPASLIRKSYDPKVRAALR